MDSPQSEGVTKHRAWQKQKCRGLGYGLEPPRLKWDIRQAERQHPDRKSRDDRFDRP